VVVNTRVELAIRKPVGWRNMNRFYVLVCVGCFALTYNLTRANEIENGKSVLLHNGQKIVFMGDSITAYGWSQPGGYVRLVIDALRKEGVVVTPIAAGISGNTSKDMLERLQQDVLSKKPDLMTLSCGVNDVWHGVNGIDLRSYKNNITAIIDQATTNGIRVLILTATPIGEDENINNKRLVGYNEFLRQLSRKRGLLIADLNDDFQRQLKKFNVASSSRILTVDGVHMNSEGNIIMAKGCLRALGFTDSELGKIENEWIAETNTAMFAVSYDAKPNLGLTLGQYRRLQQIARERHTSLLQLDNTLWLQSIGDVMKSREHDAVVDEMEIQKETSMRLMQKINDLTAN
jgi:lysophospholipase L1-like esterase